MTHLAQLDQGLMPSLEQRPLVMDMSEAFSRIVAITAISTGHGGNGRVGDPTYYSSGFTVDECAPMTFLFYPDDGYQVKEVCPQRYAQCIPWNTNEYTLANVGVEDWWSTVSYEPILNSSTPLSSPSLTTELPPPKTICTSTY